jgi:DNA-binding transcriptional LysR family regulator
MRRRLGIGRKALCAAPAYLARHGRPERPEDLAGHNCLVYLHMPLEGRWQFTGADGEHDIEVSGSLRSNSIEGLRAAALAGLGICLLPMVNVSDDLRQGLLVRLLPDYRTTEVEVQAVYPPGRHTSMKVRTFIDFLVEKLCTAPAAVALARAAATA